MEPPHGRIFGGGGWAAAIRDVHRDSRQPGEKTYQITAVAEYAGTPYKEGYEVTGYSGVRPYYLYRPATYKTTGVDVKVAPGLKVAT